MPGLGREAALPRLVERHLVVSGGRDVNVVLSARADGARACRESTGEDIDRPLARIDAVLRKIFGFEQGSSRRPRRHAAGMTRIDEHHQLARLGGELLQARLYLRIDETVSVVGEERFGTTVLRILDALSRTVPGVVNEHVVVLRNAFIEIAERFFHPFERQLSVAQNAQVGIRHAQLAGNLSCAHHVLRDTRQRRGARDVVFADRHDQRVRLGVRASAKRQQNGKHCSAERTHRTPPIQYTKRHLRPIMHKSCGAGPI